MKFIKSTFFIYLICCLAYNVAFAQASGISPEFKATIDQYLSFSVPTITVDQLKNNKANYTILDAREMEEFKISHIPGAIYIGYDDFNRNEARKLSREKPIVVYCSIGYRSEKIGEILAKEGFKNVHNLYGSIFAWANAGLPLHDQGEKKTQNIHGYNRSWAKWVENKSLNVIH